MLCVVQRSKEWTSVVAENDYTEITCNGNGEMKDIKCRKWVLYCVRNTQWRDKQTEIFQTITELRLTTFLPIRPSLFTFFSNTQGIIR